MYKRQHDKESYQESFSRIADWHRTIRNPDYQRQSRRIYRRRHIHEIDHLDGVLFIDHIKDQTDAFYKLNDKGDLEPLDYDKYIKNNKDLFPDEEE